MAGETIGLIDDDRAVRRGLTRLLHACGYRVEAFESADEFLGRPSDVNLDCLLLDLRLPGLTGLQLHDRLVQSGWRVPIIFITGHSDAAAAETDGRGVAVLAKPFDDAALLEAIEAALARGPRHQGPRLSTRAPRGHQ